jgi:catechol 2,3-dioxygenase
MTVTNARLHHLQITSPDPAALARFYLSTMYLQSSKTGGIQLCSGPERLLLIVNGPARQLGFAAWAFPDRQEFEAFRQRLEKQNVPLLPSPSPLFQGDAFSVLDPDGNQLVFALQPDSPDSATEPAALQARLQHVTVGSTQCEAMLAFYTDVLGFTVSDKVLKDDGALTTFFVRSDPEHHSLAVFRTPEKILDHHSYELREWNLTRDWADHFANFRVPLVWGPGRHGPGNNLFFFVQDTDGNHIEISTEIEICKPGQPTGIWPHEERTLNLWGRGVLRS